MLWLDHVTMVTADPEATLRRLLRTYGFDSIPGLSFGAIGIESIYIPFPHGFIQILAVTDQRTAANTPEGGFVANAIEEGRTWLGWALATDDLDPITTRNGCEPVPGFSSMPDGSEITWRMACTRIPLTDPGLPLFIEWLHAERHPGRPRPRHRVKVHGIEWIEIGCEADRFHRWVGEDLPWVRIAPDEPPGVRAVGIATADGEIVLDGSP